VIQTGAEVYFTHVYQAGKPVRKLEYNRDYGRWVAVEGVPQPWEQAHFFGRDAKEDGVPDMVWEDVSEADRLVYQAAREAGVVGEAIHLLHPSSTAPMYRVCAAFNINEGEASGRWSLAKTSLFSRLFSRHRG
jgi:hypothetical protein